MNKEVDIKTFYRNNQDDINVLYNSILIQLEKQKLYPENIKSLDFSEFLNFIYNHSDRSYRSYYD